MTPHESYLKEKAESEAWEAFLSRENSIGRKRGRRKCICCGQYKPSTDEFWRPSKYGTSRHRYERKCRECEAIGPKQPKRNSFNKATGRNFKEAYTQSVIAYQGLMSLSARMFHLLQELKPSLNGLGYRLDEIEISWKELSK